MTSPGSDPSDDLAYPVHQHTLANGLRVIVSPDHNAPAAALNLWYDVGSRHEEPGRTGFAHLFEHLMFQGSAGVASGEHIALLQAHGAAVNATTWFDRTNYFEALPTGGLDLALWLEADRLESLLDAVTQENLDNQREVVKEEKRQRYDNVPYGDLMERLVALVFPSDHPYGHTTIGSMADLDAATVEDVHAFFRRHYLPSNCVLTIVGDVTVDDAYALVERRFGHLPSGPKPDRALAAPLPPLTGLPRAEVDADVPASSVALAWRLPALGDPELDALDLATTVLGGSQTSRLHRALVRRDEVAEGAGASVMPLVGGNSFGFVTARARDGVSIDTVEQSLLAEVERLADEGPTDDEVTRAHARFERDWLQSLASLDTRADQFSAYATLLGDPTRVNRRVADMATIDGTAIRDACRTHLRAEQRATLVHHALPKASPSPATQEGVQ
ncbi:M16 family metallopeptidase [Mariniluteicoccus flavus]